MLSFCTDWNMVINVPSLQWNNRCSMHRGRHCMRSQTGASSLLELSRGQRRCCMTLTDTCRKHMMHCSQQCLAPIYFRAKTAARPPVDHSNHSLRSQMHPPEQEDAGLLNCGLHRQQRSRAASRCRLPLNLPFLCARSTKQPRAQHPAHLAPKQRHLCVVHHTAAVAEAGIVWATWRDCAAAAKGLLALVASASCGLLLRP